MGDGFAESSQITADSTLLDGPQFSGSVNNKDLICTSVGLKTITHNHLGKRHKSDKPSVGDSFDAPKDGSKSTISTHINGPPANYPPVYFPLCLDHLIVLVQYNVLRAIVTNIAIVHPLLSIPTECDSIVPLELFPLPPTSALPASLQPTLLQQTTPHEFWVDIIPHAQWRDNMILAAATYDQDDMCVDIVGGLWEGFSDNDRRGLIAWSDPWDVNGWEVSEGFWGKWGWLLKGCNEVMEATNRWRALRGDEPLIIEL